MQRNVWFIKCPLGGYCGRQLNQQNLTRWHWAWSVAETSEDEVVQRARCRGRRDRNPISLKSSPYQLELDIVLRLLWLRGPSDSVCTYAAMQTMLQSLFWEKCQSTWCKCAWCHVKTATKTAITTNSSSICIVYYRGILWDYYSSGRSQVIFW